jgi:hypothetical protein
MELSAHNSKPVKVGQYTTNLDFADLAMEQADRLAHEKYDTDFENLHPSVQEAVYSAAEQDVYTNLALMAERGQDR